MTHVLRIWPNFLASLLMVTQIVGCYGPIWPSRGMTVKLSNSGPSALEIKNVVATELQSQGFIDIGKDGRDEINNQRTNFNFEGPDDLLVSVGVDAVNEAPIRVSQNRKTFTPEANHIFESLAAALEARWPGSVMREPKPEK